MSKARNAATLGASDADSERLAFYDVTRECMVPVYDGQIFGRHTSDEQYQDDKQMSREHCKIRLIRHGVFIEDLGSSNATRVNQKPIAAGVPVMINRNDVIEIGNQKFVVILVSISNETHE